MSAPRGRPLWLRIVLQLALAAVVPNVVILVVALLVAHLDVDVAALAARAGARGSALHAISLAGSAAPMFIFGALAAVLTWLVTRQPWDALGASALFAAQFLVTGMTYSPRAAAFRAELWWWPWVGIMAADVVAIFVGCALTAWLLQKRDTRLNPQPEAVS